MLAGPRGVVPEVRGPVTIAGAGDSPAVPAVTVDIPPPTPAPDITPEVSTPRAPVESVVSPAIVSLMLRPARLPFGRSVRSASLVRFPVASLPVTGTSFNLGSII